MSGRRLFAGLILGCLGGWLVGPGAEPTTAGADAELEQARRQVATIAADVAALRHLELRHEVPIELLSMAAFEEYLLVQLEQQLSPEKARATELALEALGWIDRPLDLRQQLIDMMLGQAAAIYDPETGHYLLIEGALDSLMVETISTHELTHALTDQHFDLNAMIMQPARSGLSEDRAQALRYLVEGDASYIMMLREMMLRLPAMLGHTLDAGADPLADAAMRTQAETGLRMGLEQIQGMPYESLLQMHQGSAAVFGERMAAAAASLDTVPRILVRPLIDAYLGGALLVADVLEHGGWPALDSLYVDPPVSTEQVLHFDRLYPVRDDPRVPVMQSPASLMTGWDLLLDDTFGELYVRVLFETVGMQSEADALAAGWDGDRLVVIGRDEDWFVVWASIWDDTDEAAEFLDGYRRLLAAREGAKELAPAPRTGGDAAAVDCWLVNGRATCVAGRGEQVAIAQAADVALARRLIEQSLPRGESGD